MTPRSLVLCFLLAPAALAQTDLSVKFFTAPERARSGDDVTYVLHLENQGPFDAENVVVEADLPGQVTHVPPGCAAGKPIRCTIARFSPTNQVPFWLHLSTRLPGESGTVTARATVASATPDPNPANDAGTHATTLVALPDLSTSQLPYDIRVDPFSTAKFEMSTANISATPAQNVRLTGTLTNGGTILGYRQSRPTRPVACTFSGPTITCELGTLGKFEGAGALVEFATADRLGGGTLRVVAEATSSAEDFDPSNDRLEMNAIEQYRWLVVSNTNDEGAGSLRQALLDSQGCRDREFCKIAFRIEGPVPESGYFTIRPRSPLPPVRGTIVVDGGTQTTLSGITNAQGPEIEINGALAGPNATGLTVAGGCEVSVRSLAINGFDGHGIVVRDDSAGPCTGPFLFPAMSIGGNFIGTDPRGHVAVPNRRGIVVEESSWMEITENIISGNARAGVFVHHGHHVNIARNRIGAGLQGEAIGNGARGVFVDDASADVAGNVIAHNGEWGVGRSSRPHEISIVRNRIFDHGLLGIDVGLDFETPPVQQDAIAPNPPVLLSATYDPATNVTTIRGRFASRPPEGLGRWEIEVFANRALNRSGRAEGEEIVAILNHIIPGDFTATVREDLTGRWITATTNRERLLGAKPLGHSAGARNNTSEFSNAVEVIR